MFLFDEAVTGMLDDAGRAEVFLAVFAEEDVELGVGWTHLKLRGELTLLQREVQRDEVFRKGFRDYISFQLLPAVWTLDETFQVDDLRETELAECVSAWKVARNQLLLIV